MWISEHAFTISEGKRWGEQNTTMKRDWNPGGIHEVAMSRS